MYVACGHKQRHLWKRQNIWMSSWVLIKPVAIDEECNCFDWQRPIGCIIGRRLVKQVKIWMIIFLFCLQHIMFTILKSMEISTKRQEDRFISLSFYFRWMQVQRSCFMLPMCLSLHSLRFAYSFKQQGTNLTSKHGLCFTCSTSLTTGTWGYGAVFILFQRQQVLSGLRVLHVGVSSSTGRNQQGYEFTLLHLKRQQNPLSFTLYWTAYACISMLKWWNASCNALSHYLLKFEIRHSNIFCEQ